jgi:hypothetical protein
MDQIIYIYNKLISLIIIYMGHKKKKHAKIYNKNSNKINITIHNDTKNKAKRRANKPKSGISSQLGQPAQTSTALYNAKEDQSDLINQASNYTNHVKKQYNALLENIAADERPRPPPQIQAAPPPQENFLHSIMNGIVQKGGMSITFPKKEKANTGAWFDEDEPMIYNSPRKETKRNDLIDVLNQFPSHKIDDGQDNTLDLNAKAVKPRGRPKGSKTVKVPMSVSSHIQTRSTTPKLNEMAAAIPVQEELNLGGDEAINNVDLNAKAVEEKPTKRKYVRKPKNIV